MKNLIKKLSIVITFITILAISFVSNFNSIEPAEAYFGDWKSNTQECQVVKTITTIESLQGREENGSFIEKTRTEIYEGTRRVCVDGRGWCFWGSSCS